MKGRKLSNKVQLQVELYKSGMSAGKVAKELGMKKNSVIKNLLYRNVLRKNSGYQTEQDIFKWLSKNKIKFTPSERGDAPYDVVVSGKRIDIKGTTINSEGLYYFSLNHKLRATPNKERDLFWFVCSDGVERKIYEAPAEEFNHIKRGTQFQPENTKYNLRLIGILD